MKKTVYILTPFFAFFFLILDGQLTTLLVNYAPYGIIITSHCLLMFGLFCTLFLPLYYSLILFAFMGFIYDVYYLNLVGMATTLWPLAIYFAYFFFQQLEFSWITSGTMLLILIFGVDFGSFLLARLFHLTILSMYIFVFNDLLPTLLLNCLLLVGLFPIIKMVFGITNTS